MDYNQARPTNSATKERREAVTVDEFELKYATGSGLTVDQLHESNLYGEPCNNCDYRDCQGWKMVNRKERAIMEAVELLHREWPAILKTPELMIDPLDADLIG